MRHKRVQIIKNGCIEASLLGCTSGVNTAHQLCGGLGAAYSFFDLELAPELVESILPDSAAMATARALAFLDFFGQLSRSVWYLHRTCRGCFPATICTRQQSVSRPYQACWSSPVWNRTRTGCWLLVALDEPEVLVELGELLVLA